MASRPLHIVYVTLAGGGVETYVCEIARTLSEQGQRASIIYLHHSPRSSRDQKQGPEHAASRRTGAVVVEQATPSNLHYYYGRALSLLPPSGRTIFADDTAIKNMEISLAVRRALRRVARRAGRIDLIELPDHFHYPTAFVRDIAPIAVKLHSSTADWNHQCHEPLSAGTRRSVSVEKQLLRHARLVYAPSTAMADHVAEFYGYPRRDIAVVHNPLDVDHFAPATECIENTDHRPSVLYVGRLNPYKGLLTLARAAEAIVSAIPAARLDIVGADAGEMDISSFWQHIPPHLRPCVVLHGRVGRDRLPEYYRRAAVCVVPSRWEPWGYTVAEAMACGTAVVATKVGGIVDSVVDGETGLLVPPDNPAALAAAVTALLADQSLRVRMGQRARERAVERFSRADIAGQTLELYRRALAGTDATRSVTLVEQQV